MKNMNPKQKQIMKVCKFKCHYFLLHYENNGCVQLVINATTHDSQIV